MNVVTSLILLLIIVVVAGLGLAWVVGAAAGAPSWVFALIIGYNICSRANQS